MSPTNGTELFTVLMVLRSEELTMIVSSRSSRVWFVSSWSWVLLIVFVKVCPAVPLSTLATKTRDSESPAGKLFIAHEGEIHNPVEGKPDIYVNPEGNRSETTKFVAEMVPLLETVIV